LVFLLSAIVLTLITASAQASRGCQAPLAPSRIPEGWDFRLNGLSGPAEVPAGGTIEVQFCAPPEREGFGKDNLGTYLVGTLGTDAIDAKRRFKSKGICTYEDEASGDFTVTGGHSTKTLRAGNQTGLIEARYYLSVLDDSSGKSKEKDSFHESSRVWSSESVCVTKATSSSNAETGVPALTPIAIAILASLLGLYGLRKTRSRG
jgi:hypothetical protein